MLNKERLPQPQAFFHEELLQIGTSLTDKIAHTNIMFDMKG
ncbi:hypothetical protein BPUM_2721 [Bacillus pumilus SAFR-032]|uniref:Uncharacterized protein n=1 Tax=Bacillus pumilus (strain SAFR-032) TaxID=315750 RepID=A8FGL2_BACP2|nr:hypothetical protein BPUM_2721 [Bacillus pumilus SAFR-032]